MKNSLRKTDNQDGNSTEVSVFIKTMENQKELKALQSVMTANLMKLFPETKLIRYETLQESTPIGVLNSCRIFYRVVFPDSEEN